LDVKNDGVHNLSAIGTYYHARRISEFFTSRRRHDVCG